MGKVIKVSDEVFERLEKYETKNPNKDYWGYYIKKSKNLTIEKLLKIAEELDEKEAKKTKSKKVTKKGSK